MENIISAIKKYQKLLTPDKEKAIFKAYENLLEREISHIYGEDTTDELCENFSVHGLFHFFPLSGEELPETLDSKEASNYIADLLNDKYARDKDSGFSRGGIATSLQDIEDYFTFVKSLFPMDEILESILEKELEDDDTQYGGVGFKGETVDNFILDLSQCVEIENIDTLNDALVECGIKPFLPSAIKTNANELMINIGTESWIYYKTNKNKALEALNEFLHTCETVNINTDNLHITSAVLRNSDNEDIDIYEK